MTLKPAHGAALAVALALCAPALAQDPSVPLRGQDSDPKLPSPNEQIPEKIKPDSGDSPGSGATLSEKLERSDGVIKPPSGVDPEIRTIPPEPNPNSTPVIRPPDNAK